MKALKAFTIEAENARFTLTISARHRGAGFVGEYVGMTPKYAQELRPGQPYPMMREIGQGTIAGDDIGQVIANCRSTVEEIDGPILETRERDI